MRLSSARNKRQRTSDRERRETLPKMTVVNARFGYRNVVLLTHELQQCHVALLYADEVTLVHPRAALMRSDAEIGKYDGLDLLSEPSRIVSVGHSAYYVLAAPSVWWCDESVVALRNSRPYLLEL